ncbi:hypothetical protein ABN236_08500 [Proteus sp. fly-1013]|uniref:hypothetical protein n=1 Tax=Proteus sp. fly-1013 TaxID=3136673 RepID=UPI0032DB8F3A
MKISFNDLVNSLFVNHKKESTKFLLSNEITECLNTLTKDDFFVLEGKGKDTGKNIYIDKAFFHKMESELINLIKDYTKDNLYHLAKVLSVNDVHKVNSPLIREDKEFFSFLNLDSLGNVRDFISKLIKKTNSSTLKDNIFNKDKCPTIHMLFKKELLAKAEIKSLSQLVKELSNKTRELNPGCELPYQLDNQNNILLVKLGDLEAANYGVQSNDKPYQYSGGSSDRKNNLEKIKNIIIEFEIHFNFLNEYLRQYHEVVDNSCFFENVKGINDISNFIDGNVIENIKETHYKNDNLLSFTNELVDSFNKFHSNHKELDSFYQKNIFNVNDDAIENLDLDNLEHKLKQLKSNTDFLKKKIESLNDFSTCVEQCNNEFRNKLYHLKSNSKKIVCDSIIKVKEKTNECLSLLDDFIKRKETGFLSKVYKLFFPKKYNKSLNLLTDYKREINKISSYLDNYKEEGKCLSINDVGLIVTSSLSKINYPDSLFGYLYGEKRKCDNFIQSLFKK